jgi:hypothetical protein
MNAVVYCSLMLFFLICGIYCVRQALADPHGRHERKAPAGDRAVPAPRHSAPAAPLPQRVPFSRLRVPPYLPSPGTDDTRTDLPAVRNG